MSNGITYDPLLVRYLAEELDRAIRGRACAAAPFFAPDLSVVLPVGSDRVLRLDLHPSRGWVRLMDRAGAAPESRCVGVTAPADERRISIELAAPDRFGGTARRLVIELHTNQWNAILLSAEDERILAVLRARTAGGRELRPGVVYSPPPGLPRFGADPVGAAEAWARWLDVLGGAAPGDRRALILRGFAYTGATNAVAILGDAAASDDRAELRAAFERWWALRALPEPSPTLLGGLGGGRLPYPLPLPDTSGEPIASILHGMDRLASASDASDSTGATETATGGEGAAAMFAEAARGRADSLDRRVQRLEEELAGAGEADRLRSWGDLLLARLRQLPRGADRAELEDWDGEAVVIPLDPALTPAENATRLYDEARKRGRAEERIPALLEEARSEAARWREAAEDAEAGRVPDWAREALTGGGEGRRGGETLAEPRPYRSYRTSGGLEVRVGRSARANDRLTFGHSSPNDVWLHAQSVPGSHVVLRWPSGEDAPPARDLEEAAVLAARYSRARTSALVAVDWTRRKHVRKPRGAPPGRVVIQRAKTVFVEPDPAVEERLRID